MNKITIFIWSSNTVDLTQSCDILLICLKLLCYPLFLVYMYILLFVYVFLNQGGGHIYVDSPSS